VNLQRAAQQAVAEHGEDNQCDYDVGPIALERKGRHGKDHAGDRRGHELIAASLQGVESHLRQMAVSSNPAPNYQRPLSEYPIFDGPLLAQPFSIETRTV
jgi:hypothetical protein